MRLSTQPSGTPLGASPAPAPQSGGPAPALERFNSCPPPEAESALLTCCASPRWARRVAAHRPYPDVEALLAAGDEASYDLRAEELKEALAGETAPHVAGGEPQQGTLAAHTALRAAQAAYESTFGHPFVICLDDCAPGERLDSALAGIRVRLGHEWEEERAVAAEELRRVTRGRLVRLLASPPSASTGA